MSSLVQRSFTAGEIAPSLYARVDQVKYATGLKTCRNMIVMRSSGVQNRPGTTYVAEVSDSSETVRLIPFIFNADQTYVLEFGDQYMRVHRNGEQVTETAKVITNATQGTPCVITSAAHGFSNGNEVFISGIAGMTVLNNRNFKVAGVTTNTFQLNYMDGTPVDSTAFTAYSAGGTAARIYEISTPYLTASLSTIQFVQSADVIILVHLDYAPRQLSRTSATSWTLAAITFAPGIAAPTGVANGGAAGSTTQWVVTAVASETYEESLPSSSTGTSATPSSGSPISVTWSAVSGAQSYNIYKNTNGVYGFIGVAQGTSFSDIGITADTTDTPPISRNPFGSTDNYPSAVTYFQQRLFFANTRNNPQGVWSSKSSAFKNFTISSPLQDDDAITFTIVGRQVNSVKHLVDMNTLLAMTSGSEVTVTGDSAGILRPGQINIKQNSYNGSSDLSPITGNGIVLYVQARRTIVRDLGFDFRVDGYVGNDLTIFSSHLFDQYSLVDWGLQKVPQPVVWAARSDGTLLGMTYVRDQEIFGWHRHDFAGLVENVCVVPEGTEDALYLVIKRTIDGQTKRYIERMASRQIDDIIDSVFMDSALSYDGRNTDDSHSMTLSGGTTWAYTETITLTSSTSFFTAEDVGNEIQLMGSDGTLIRFEITGYSSATVVTGKPNKTVPAAMRSAAISDWAKAVDEVGGLWHLEGEDVSILGDRFVVASPNNSANVIRTVTDGIVTLDRPYAVIHVGLPYVSDFETLDVDAPQGETIADKKKFVGTVSLYVDETRGVFAGRKAPSDDSVDPLEGLYEAKLRDEEGYDDPVALKTGIIPINIQGNWNSNGHFFARQVDPVPLSILAAIPAGLFPFKG